MIDLVPQCAALGGCAVAGAIDARTGHIPDRVSILTAAAAFVCATATGRAADAIAGGFATGVLLLALYVLTGRHGLGLGDVKLGAAIGIGLGPAAGIAALGTAFVLGAAYGTWLLTTRRARRDTAIPFGPFLTAGTLAVSLASFASPNAQVIVW